MFHKSKDRAVLNVTLCSQLTDEDVDLISQKLGVGREHDWED